jgi:hypothetical protein
VNVTNDTELKKAKRALPPAPEVIQPDALYSASQVRAMCGGISDMTLRRWETEHPTFPAHIDMGVGDKPGKAHRFWRGQDLLNFLTNAPRSRAKVTLRGRTKAPIEQFPPT